MRGHCHLCGEDTKLTREHVIPQCLGGILLDYLYCADCNGKCGHEVDSELARQFSRYATLLCLSRARGRNQPFEIEEVDGGLRLRCDGETLRRAKPEVRLEKSQAGALRKAEVIAGSKEQLINIMQGLAKQYDFDPDACLLEASERDPPVAFHEFVLENALIRRAVAKIAYGFACTRLARDLVGGPQFDAIRSFILDEGDHELASANFAEGEFMVDNQRPLHKIHLRYERENKLLVGYVALFGTFRYTIVLADNLESAVEWAGIDYTYNPVTQRHVDGNEHYVAPAIGKERALKPKHSRAMVLEALKRGQNVIVNHSSIVKSAHVEERGTPGEGQ